MKQRIIDLMRLGFTSQWVEMIIKHGGDFSQWRSFIRDGRYDSAIEYVPLVGMWDCTPQGFDYWHDCAQTLLGSL